LAGAFLIRLEESGMEQLPYGIWEAAFGRLKNAGHELNSARIILERLKSLEGEPA
jgi:hypothetical protein